MKQRRNETKGQALAWARWVALIAVALAIVLSSVFILPDYLVELDLNQGAQLSPVELVKAKNDVRSTLLQGIGAIVLVIGALAAWRQLQLSREQLQASREQMQNNEELTRLQLKMSEQGQITERFTRAIEQLASDKLDVRLGGIYGLERLAADSAVAKDVIVEILLALVHQRSPWPPGPEQLAADEPIEKLLSLRIRAPDIETAVAVLGRLPVPEEMRPRFYLGRLDLRRVHLGKADLAGAYLGRSNLSRAGLEGADLRSVNLSWASLVGANLKEASLEDAILEDVDFRQAQLEGARLIGATASSGTRWPDGFDWKAAGVIIEVFHSPRQLAGSRGVKWLKILSKSYRQH